MDWLEYTNCISSSSTTSPSTCRCMMYRVMHQSAHPLMMLLSSQSYAPQNLTTETAFSTHYMYTAPDSSKQSCPWDEGGTASLDPSRVASRSVLQLRGGSALPRRRRRGRCHPLFEGLQSKHVWYGMMMNREMTSRTLHYQLYKVIATTIYA